MLIVIIRCRTTVQRWRTDRGSRGWRSVECHRSYTSPLVVIEVVLDLDVLFLRHYRAVTWRGDGPVGTPSSPIGGDCPYLYALVLHLRRPLMQCLMLLPDITSSKGSTAVLAYMRSRSCVLLLLWIRQHSGQAHQGALSVEGDAVVESQRRRRIDIVVVVSDQVEEAHGTAERNVCDQLH